MTGFSIAHAVPVEGAVGKREEGEPWRVVFGAERGGIVEDTEQGVEVCFVGASQIVGVFEQKHATPRRHAVEIAQTVGQCIPVEAECRWQLQSDCQALDRKSVV